MAEVHLSVSARNDIASILEWTDRKFGVQARRRYASLITAAIKDAAHGFDDPRLVNRPELGEGVVTWHLASRRFTTAGGRVNRPRHFLICRFDDEILIIVRMLHDAMDLGTRFDPGADWL